MLHASLIFGRWKMNNVKMERRRNQTYEEPNVSFGAEQTEQTKPFHKILSLFGESKKVEGTMWRKGCRLFDDIYTSIVARHISCV
jgi:hypothetical protein